MAKKQIVVCLTDYIQSIQEQAVKDREKAEKAGKDFSFNTKDETLACINKIATEGEIVTTFERKGEIYFVVNK